MKKITLLIVVLTAVFFSANAQFAGGSGTEASPYEIETADQLNAVRNNLGSHFILMNNIDLSEEGYPVWLAIGKSEGESVTNTPFSGVFNGNGHVISNLNITTTSLYAGLFAIVSGRIHDLGVEGSLTGTQNGGYGLVAGYVGQEGAPGEIENCYAIGTVSASGSGGTAGAGLVAGVITRASRMSGCYSKGVVTAPELTYVGGIVGRVQQNTCFLFNCYSEASVTGGTNVGGITGRIYSNQANDMNIGFLYSTGRVIGKNWVGGIAGDNYTIKAMGLIAANSAVQATNADGNVARIAPTASGTPQLEYCYGLNTTEVKKGTAVQTPVSNDAGPDGATKTLAQLQDSELYEETEWDMEEMWEIPAGGGLPILQWQKDMQTNINKVQAGEAATVYMQGKMLHIANIEPATAISVYNVNGQLVKQQVSSGTSDVIILTQPGVYIVKVAGISHAKTAKIICE